MILGYTEEETHRQMSPEGDDQIDAKPHAKRSNTEQDLHEVCSVLHHSLTNPRQGDAVNHVTTDMLNPPNQMVTCRHWLVLPVAFLFMVAYQCTFYVFGQYVYIKLQREKYPNITIKTTSVCEANTSSIGYQIQLDVQETAARWTIYLYLSGGVVTVIATIMLGSLTDRFGRKFLFILPLIGTIIRTVMAIFGIKYDLPLQYHAIGYFIEGCTGQVFTIFLISYVYVSDITPVGKMRSIGIVTIDVALGLGVALISVGAGYLLKLTNFLVPYYLSLGLLGVTLILVLFLPETYPKEARENKKYTSIFENLKDASNLYFSSKNAGTRWMYILTLVVFSLTSFNLFGRNSMEGLYLLNAPFCWGPEKIGIFGAMKSGFQNLLGMGLVAVFHMFMGDAMISIVGCISYGASFILEGLASTDLMMYVVAVVGTCGLLTIPMLRSIMSQMTSPHKQGALFASISLAEGLLSLVGAVTSNYVYIATVDVFRGLTFMMFAASSVGSIVLMLIFYFATRTSKMRYQHMED